MRSCRNHLPWIAWMCTACLVLLSLTGPALAQDALRVSGLYGRTGSADQYGVLFTEDLGVPRDGVRVYAGALSVIDRRYEKYLSGEGVLGVRIAWPGRFSPWLGAGVTVGFSATREEGEDYDNHWQAGVMPEAGLDLWLSSRGVLMLSGCYLVTTDGRDEDCWLAGLGVGWMMD